MLLPPCIVQKRRRSSVRALRYQGTYFVVLFVLIASLLVACGDRGQPQATPTPIPTPARPLQPTYVVQRGTVVVSATFNGRVSAAAEVQLYFRRDGIVRRVYVQRGDDVHQGDLLAELEAADLERELARAQHNLEMAKLAFTASQQAREAQIAEAEHQVRLAELQLEAARKGARHQLRIAQQELAKLQAQDPAPQKAQAEARLEQARVQLKQTQAAYDAVAWRPDIAALPQAMQLQQATLTYQQAKAAYELALQAVHTHAIDLKIQEENVAQARRRLERLEDKELNTPEELAQAQAQQQLGTLRKGKDLDARIRLEDARFQVDDVRARLEETRLQAPVDARVIALSVAAGQSVRAYQPVLILADPQHLAITAQPDTDTLASLREGQPVTITVPSRPGLVLPGHIDQLPYPYGSGGKGKGTSKDTTMRIRFDRDPIVQDFQMGDLVEVHVILARKENVLWLPPAAIRTFGGRTFVVVQEGNLRRRVNVTLGLQGRDRVEIRSGLEEGQVVIGP